MIAWKAYCEEIEDYERIIYGAQGIRLPPKVRSIDKALAALTPSERWALRVKKHNAEFSGRERAIARGKARAAERRKAAASAPPPNRPKVRP